MGFFDKIKEKLIKTRDNIGNKINEVFSGFKKVDEELLENLEEVSKEALEQIENKKYDVSLKQNGIKDITYMGIAFCGKQIKIEYK